MNANCINTVGGHNCSCKEGFAGDGRSCSGILSFRVKNKQVSVIINCKLFVLYFIWYLIRDMSFLGNGSAKYTDWKHSLPVISETKKN